MKHTFPSIVLAASLLAACAPSGSSSHGGGHVRMDEGGRELAVEDRGTDAEIAFLVKEGDRAFVDFGVSHTKEMHVIVVREDLRHFSHLHPERDAQGIWRLRYAPPAGGVYRFYADFVESGGASHTIRFDRVYPGDKGDEGVVRSAETTKTFDGYRIEFKPGVSGDDVTFAYAITDDRGKGVMLEEYLGATGHSVLLSPDGDFIHTHPSDTGASPVFVTAKPEDDFYRVFTQFKIAGKVVTTEFDWVR